MSMCQNQFSIQKVMKFSFLIKHQPAYIFTLLVRSIMFRHERVCQVSVEIDYWIRKSQKLLNLK